MTARTLRVMAVATVTVLSMVTGGAEAEELPSYSGSMAFVVPPQIVIRNGVLVICVPNPVRFDYALTPYAVRGTTYYSETLQVTASVPPSCDAGVKAVAQIIDGIPYVCCTFDTGPHPSNDAAARSVTAAAHQDVPYFGPNGTRPVSKIVFHVENWQTGAATPYFCMDFPYLFAPAVAGLTPLPPEEASCIEELAGIN